jgi:nickel/cobalt transporter (NicO) family protein
MMPDLQSIIEQGSANPWLFLPVAVLLGALHALEPGHSKSMMAAFIIAIRGTAAQGAMLGVSAAVGHTIIVWGLALIGLWLGDKLIIDKAEPWLLLISGLLVMGLAWRLIGLMRANKPEASHTHDHGHDHDHADDSDAHAAAHGKDIETRFAGRRDVSPGEIIWFGFTGGLLPCPAAIAVLLVCLQLKKYGLGVAMVAAFSLGLAVTMVAIGVTAAWGARKAAGAWSGFDGLASRLPLISGSLVMLLGFALSVRGLFQLGVFGGA